jgi:hypothetical protein
MTTEEHAFYDRKNFRAHLLESVKIISRWTDIPHFDAEEEEACLLGGRSSRCAPDEHLDSQGGHP